MTTPRLCSVDGCGKPARGHGLCSMHYTRLRRNGDMSVRTQRPSRVRPCAVDGCDELVHSHDYCSRHAQRFVRHGDPLGGGTSWGEPFDWLLAHKAHNSTECLLWPFARYPNGYAVLRHDGRNERAHRLMCTLVHGEAPTQTHDACHNCGKGHEGCVNPNHLRWDTRAGNFADKLTHGTHNRGEQCPVAKLTETDVREIRSLIGSMPFPQIAARFSVSTATIHDIKNRKSWFWLD